MNEQEEHRSPTCSERRASQEAQDKAAEARGNTLSERAQFETGEVSVAEDEAEPGQEDDATESQVGAKVRDSQEPEAPDALRDSVAFDRREEEGPGVPRLAKGKQ